MESDKNCGCKGIRTCLICEKEGKLSKVDDKNKETVQYEYCPYCDLCWPLDNDSGSVPLYLGKLTLIPEFVTEAEEKEIVAAIDTLGWMPSQSGRRKQDFGPKVNFKKKKGKIGDFKGFPSFTEDLIQRLKQHEDLSDFYPVELCHLDYDPGRGSAIEPHIDDTWIWGERLVTLNLVSPTVLIFTSANVEEVCDCQSGCLNTSDSSSNETSQCNIALDCLNTAVCSLNAMKQCHTLLECSSSDCSLNDSSLVNGRCTANGIGQEELKEPFDGQNKSLVTCLSNADSIKENNNHNGPLPTLLKDSHHPKDSSPIPDLQSKCFRTPIESNRNKILRCSHDSIHNGKETSVVKTMCTAYRIGQKGPKIEVWVSLPARSLVVVAGCSRYNWFHEIRRKNIGSRRLAMTFRELSQSFMSGGPDEILGNELLQLGRTFWKMTV